MSRPSPPLDRLPPPRHKRRVTPEDDIAALDFETALARLEQIVRKLETGEASLEDSIGLYGEGDRLKAHCESKLAAAQARIEKIRLGPDGKPAGLTPFDAA